MSNIFENDKIKPGKRYFLLMRPIRKLPFIGWEYIRSSDEEKWVECEIVESAYSAYCNKVVLVALEKEYGAEEFYPEDFISMLNSGKNIIEKVRDDQHVEEITWKEPLTSTVFVEHHGYIVI